MTCEYHTERAKLTNKISGGAPIPQPLPIIPMESITLERMEGLVTQINLPVTANSFDEANSILLNWANSAPAGGEGDKCRILISYDDQDEVVIDYDLRYEDQVEEKLVQRQLKQFLEYHAGLACPAAMSEENYQKFLSFAEAISPGATDLAIKRMLTLQVE